MNLHEPNRLSILEQLTQSMRAARHRRLAGLRLGDLSATGVSRPTRRYDRLVMFDNVPQHVKLMFLIGVLSIGPIIAVAALLGGFHAVVPTVAILFVGGIISYLVTIRKYTKQD